MPFLKFLIVSPMAPPNWGSFFVPKSKTTTPPIITISGILSTMNLQNCEIERLRQSEPQGVMRVIQKFVAGDRMNEHRMRSVIEHQKTQHIGKNRYRNVHPK